MKTEEQDEQTSQLLLFFRILVYFQNLNRFWMRISLLNNVKIVYEENQTHIYFYSSLVSFQVR